MSLMDVLLAQPESLEDQIWNAHNEGLAPSQIAEKLHVSEEAARAEVIRRWAADKERMIDRRSSRG